MGKLRVQGLAKSFGIEVLFHDVNFEIARGEKFGFVGANGAGKTTLLRCLLGLEEADAGTVSLDTGAAVGYVEQQADFGNGTLYEEFKRAFEDIVELGKRKGQMEQAIGVSPDEETLAEYGKVVERFESLGGYDYETSLCSNFPAARRPVSAWPRPCSGSRISCSWTSLRTTWISA